MIQHEILNNLKIDFEIFFQVKDLTKESPKIKRLYSIVARELGFRYMDISRALKLDHSTVILYVQKKTELNKCEDEYIAKMVDKYKFENYLK